MHLRLRSKSKSDNANNQIRYDQKNEISMKASILDNNRGS